MLIESDKKLSYCYVKRLSALLFDQSKKQKTKQNKTKRKHYCVM